MKEISYELSYLPLFYDDLEEILEYICNTLKNPAAANRLIDDVEKSIQERLSYPESFEQYVGREVLDHPYYRIYVGNFVIFYTVLIKNDTTGIMEVRRFLYGGRNIESIM